MTGCSLGARADALLWFSSGVPLCFSNSANGMGKTAVHLQPHGLAAGQVLENRFEVDRSALANPQNWINSWSSLVTKLSANTQTARRLMVTPISNPDSANMT